MLDAYPSYRFTMFVFAKLFALFWRYFGAFSKQPHTKSLPSISIENAGRDRSIDVHVKKNQHVSKRHILFLKHVFPEGKNKNKGRTLDILFTLSQYGACSVLQAPDP